MESARILTPVCLYLTHLLWLLRHLEPHPKRTARCLPGWGEGSPTEGSWQPHARAKVCCEGEIQTQPQTMSSSKGRQMPCTGGMPRPPLSLRLSIDSGAGQWQPQGAYPHGTDFLVPQFYLALKFSCGTNIHQRRSLWGEEEANELN